MRVLYVDHNPDVCSIMVSFLERKFRIEVARSPNKALILMTKRMFNAVVVANNRGEGLKLLAVVSKTYPLTTVRMLLSGGILTEEIQNALDEGQITRFFQQPYPFLSLVGELEHDLSPPFI